MWPCVVTSQREINEGQNKWHLREKSVRCLHRNHCYYCLAVWGWACCVTSPGFFCFFSLGKNKWFLRICLPVMVHNKSMNRSLKRTPNSEVISTCRTRELGNHESSTEKRSNINIFHPNWRILWPCLKVEQQQETSASECLCLKSYIQFWRSRIDNVLGGNRYAYRWILIQCKPVSLFMLLIWYPRGYKPIKNPFQLLIGSPNWRDIIN